MATLAIQTNLKGFEGMEMIGEWLNGNFEQMIQEVPLITKKALDTAAYVLKDSVKQTFASRMPAAARPFKVPATSSRGYKITKPDMLIDAARQASANAQRTKVFMGGREKGSPLFIARMYNEGTKERKVKTRNGIKLARPRKVGQLTGVHYWDVGISTGEPQAMQVIDNIISNAIEKHFE